MRTVDEVKAERRALLRANRFVRDDFHRNADRMIETTSARIGAQLAEAATFHTGEPLDRRNPHGAMLLDAAAAWALTQPEFVTLIHEGIDQAPAPNLDYDWSKLTRQELDKQVATLDAEIAAIERELRDQERQRRHEAVDAEFAS